MVGDNVYIVCCYDVEAKRCSKYMKILRKYLFHVQESVFEGELTPKQYHSLRKEIDHLIKQDDHLIFYFTYKPKDFNKLEIGIGDFKQSIII